SYDSWPFPDEVGYGAMGYVFLLARVDGAVPTGPNGSIADTAATHFDLQGYIIPHNTAAADGSRQPNDAGKTPIAIDAVVCNATSGTNYQFGNVIGGWQFPHQSSHWAGSGANYGYPEGQNCLYLDGHAEWRPINKNGVGKTGGFNQRCYTGNMLW